MLLAITNLLIDLPTPLDHLVAIAAIIRPNPLNAFEGPAIIFFAAAIPSSLGEWLNYIRFSPHFLKLVGHVNYQPMALSSNSSTPPANLLLTRVFIVAYEQFKIGFDA